MKRYIFFFSSLYFVLLAFSCSNSSLEEINTSNTPSPTANEDPKPRPVDPIIEVESISGSVQRNGDPTAGRQYLIAGDYMESGIPYEAFIASFGEDQGNVLNRTGDNALIPPNYTAVTAPNGVRIVAPNCISCHASTLNNEFIMGLGSHDSDFTTNRADNIPILNSAVSILYGGQDSDAWQAYNQFRKSILAIGPKTITETRGANPADKIAQVLITHRDKSSLEWSDEPLIALTNEVIPTDVPAWWLLKKKHAMFYTALGRKDFCKSFIGSSLLTMGDVLKAEEVDSKMIDLLAYIYSLEAPSYPYEVDSSLADQGRELFEQNCASCHGTYGAEVTYPNLLVSLATIGTDPELSDLYNASTTFNDYFFNWFNTGWFGSEPNPLELRSDGGYLAPPLDGIWATAPYFHNGSVPTLSGVLNSNNRPKYWQRTFEDDAIDPINVGWEFTVQNSKVDRKTYDTTLKGYGNGGHTFGDLLSENERKALIEYLKTL